MRRLGVGTWLHRNIVYPAVVTARGEGAVFEGLHEFRRAERLPAAELERIQHERLRTLLEYAREHSAFYRENLPAWSAAGPADIVDYLSGVPMLSKTDLQDHADSLKARPGPLRVTRKTTGGSTGQSVTVLKNRDALAMEMAASWLAYGWFGIRIGDRAARFWGAPSNLKRRLRFAAADFATHRIRFSAFDFKEEDLERYWRRCVAFRPDYFYGYVSMLVEFANFVEENDLDGKSLGLKAIVTTAEYLSSEQRTTLSRVFGAPVQNEYGCGEVGPIAYECEHGSMHVMSPNLYVEIVDDNGAPVGEGEVGDLVITDLNNRALPLIRYQIKDRARRGSACACGRGFPVLQEILGRSYDFLCAPSGHRYHGEFLMYYFEGLRDRGLPVRQFQAVQKTADRVELRIVSAPGIEVAEVIRSELEARLLGMSIDVVSVDEIPRARSGKIRVIVNEAQSSTEISATDRYSSPRL